ncbi:hypothetical protein NYP18_09115 [Corynebacterium sp. YIM 101645]|uniref:Secreted protein n=1 Tax=Corynebacterium lemuris TaxID=1859292 RepID=A0ABT2FX52_9CORY|nr:hypothetical protein [Corynebacterium lemuris]MCS5479819.1 hypothetical protein [Corynebacterium lemuris]
MNPNEADWASVVSQGLPALAAILASAIAGLIQLWSKAGDRRHERILKAEESHREDVRLDEQRAREHIEGQRAAVKNFLHAVREQQSIALQNQAPFLEDLRDAKEKNIDAFEDRSWELEDHLWERTGNLAQVGRRKMLEAWEVMDSSVVDEGLRSVSNEIRQALQDATTYGDKHLFPGLRGLFSSESQDLEPLLHRLREASADLLNQHPGHPQPANRSQGK